MRTNPVYAEPYPQEVRAAIYCRLSKDDDLSGPSASIQNQRELLCRYCEEQGWRVAGIFQDDGFTGLNMDRPDFQKMLGAVERGMFDVILTKDLSRLGRNYLQTGQLIEEFFPKNRVRYIALNDAVDTNIENDITLFRNILNDWFARDTSKKIKAVFKAKGQSGKHLGRPPYGYKSSEQDKNVWEIDDEAAVVVRSIFQMCIDGLGPAQIARKLREQEILIPTAYAQSNGSGGTREFKSPTRWGEQTVNKILDRIEYAGHTANFKTHKKSYKNKKRIENPKSEWLIFENTHPAIISQHDFDLVSELRRNKRKIQKCGEVNPFSGMVYCADCGAKMYLCRSRSLTDEQEHMKCSTYAHDMSDCSAHFIRTTVLKKIVISELNKLLETVHINEDEFIRAAMENSVQSQESELKKARKLVKQYEKRVAELDKLFTRLYEDNVSGKISDERFDMMSKGYETEQAELKVRISELSVAIEVKEQKSADTSQFLEIVRKYTEITELTPEIMHELVEKIVVHAPDKSSGHRVQQIDIYYRFNIAVSTAIADNREYSKRIKAA